MRTLRTALTAAALSLLCLGYAASQISFFKDATFHDGSIADYYSRIDTPPIQHLALALLLSAVILAFIREKPGESEQK